MTSISTSFFQIWNPNHEGHVCTGCHGRPEAPEDGALDHKIGGAKLRPLGGARAPLADRRGPIGPARAVTGSQLRAGERRVRSARRCYGHSPEHHHGNTTARRAACCRPGPARSTRGDCKFGIFLPPPAASSRSRCGAGAPGRGSARSPRAGVRYAP